MKLSGSAFDEQLRARVAPEAWANPSPAGRYNLVVVGAGTAGLVAAAGAAGLGAKVALVERGLMGGDCLNFGCVPSKALLRSARVLADARRALDFGLRGGREALQADFAAVMERMRRLRAELADNDSAARFKELGVDVFLGEGRFTGRHTLEVAGTRLRFARALIATGGRPVALPVPGLEEAGYLTNLSLFNLTELPARLLVVGAGPIGCEMAQAFARFGSQVTVVSLDEQILPREDPEAAAIVRQALEADGVHFELGAELERVELRDGEKIVHWKRSGTAGRAVSGTAGHSVCDALLLAVGRAINVEGLGLEDAGVRTEKGRLILDDRLRTSNKHVFAAGDVAGRWQFTHTADAMARIVLRNALFFGRGKASALTVPWCTYTSPEVAHVGRYETESGAAGAELESLRIDLAEVDRAVLDGEPAGFVKAVVKKRSGRLVGATVVAEHAGEILGEACLAVTKGLKLQDLSGIVHPYPTQAAAWSRLGDLSMRKKLTPRTFGLLRALLKWRR